VYSLSWKENKYNFVDYLKEKKQITLHLRYGATRDAARSYNSAEVTLLETTCEYVS
jgi:hypothetical protein